MSDIRTELTYEQAERICENFARKHEITFKRYGQIGFGRYCSGFVKDGTWIDYRPTRVEYESPTALNPSKWVDVAEFRKADLSPIYDDVPDAYHKDDRLAVLHGDYDENFFSRMFGEDTSEDVIVETLDRDKPRSPQMESAVIQLALWVQHMEAVAAAASSELFVGIYCNGYRGMQAMINGTHEPAIGVR